MESTLSSLGEYKPHIIIAGLCHLDMFIIAYPLTFILVLRLLHLERGSPRLLLVLLKPLAHI
jgi:hypothetical protein